MRHPLAPASRQAGVSLIELVVALVVMLVLVGWAAPSFVDMRNRQALRGAMDQLQGTLAEARFEAIKRAAPTPVDFTAAVAALPAIVGTVEEPTMGDEGVIELEPRLAMLSNPAQAGSVTLSVGRYQGRFSVNALGHGSACAPEGAPPVGLPECP